MAILIGRALRGRALGLVLAVNGVVSAFGQPPSGADLGYEITAPSLVPQNEVFQAGPASSGGAAASSSGAMASAAVGEEGSQRLMTSAELTPPPAAPTAFAAAPQDQYQAILKRLDAQDAELKALREQQSEAFNIEPLPPVVDMTKRIGALEQAARDAGKFPRVRFSGFFQLDSAIYDQDHQSTLTYGRMQDGVSFRRARIEATGSVSEFTRYEFQFDFAAAGRPSFYDMWGEQANLGWLGTVRIGQFRQPGAMDGQASARHLEMLERSDAFNAMDPFRKIGIMSYNISESQRTTWWGSVYATGYDAINSTSGLESYGLFGDTRYGTYVGNHGGYSTAFRATHLLYYDEPTDGRYLLHVGGGYDFSSIGGNGGAPSSANGKIYDARTTPGVFVGDSQNAGVTTYATPYVINTGSLPANYYQYAHAELAGAYGSAHFQTEYMATTVQTIGHGDAFLNGAYFQAGYFLTGETIPYDKLRGRLDCVVTPYADFFSLGRGQGITGWGAWELTYRFDYLNLPYVVGAVAPPTAAAVAAGTTNAGTSSSNANPGELYQNTFGVNWWWNRYTKVQFNYINFTMLSDFAVYGRSNSGIFATRFEVEF